MNNSDLRTMNKAEALFLVAYSTQKLHNNMPWDDSLVKWFNEMGKAAMMKGDEIMDALCAYIEVFLQLDNMTVNELVLLYRHWLTDVTLPKLLAEAVIISIERTSKATRR